jgi:2-dehydropantoate 2-reductase
MPLPKTYTVVGAGGIGCAVGYVLRAAGARVRFIESDPAKVAWGRSNGVCVNGSPPLPAEFLLFDQWNPAADECVLICTKCYDNPSVLDRVPAGARILPIQNGFDPLFDSRGTFPEGIASFVSECVPGQAQTRITRKGHLHLGIHGQRDSETNTSNARESIEELKALLCGAGFFRLKTVDDILPYKHSKLLYNAAIGPLAAACGLDNGQLLSIARVRRLFFGLLRENYAILRGAGLTLATIGPFHPKTVDGILRLRPLAWSLAWAFYPTLRGSYCSMHADLPKGKTEIDFYNRYLIELAQNRDCPLNHAVYDAIKLMEKRKTLPSVEALNDLYVRAN